MFSETNIGTCSMWDRVFLVFMVLKQLWWLTYQCADRIITAYLLNRCWRYCSKGLKIELLKDLESYFMYTAWQWQGGVDIQQEVRDRLSAYVHVCIDNIVDLVLVNVMCVWWVCVVPLWRWDAMNNNHLCFNYMYIQDLNSNVTVYICGSQHWFFR